MGLAMEEAGTKQSRLDWQCRKPVQSSLDVFDNGGSRYKAV